MYGKMGGAPDNAHHSGAVMLRSQRSDLAIERKARIVGYSEGGQDESADSTMKNYRGRVSRS